MKTAERLQAREVRQERGLSIKEIAALLGVSQSSVSTWVRDVELSHEQRVALAARNPALSPEFNGSKTRAKRALELRREYQEQGRELARRREPLFIAGCMLYWAEGAKARNQLKFSNSDPEMAAFFMGFLRTYFAGDLDMVRVNCHLFADHAEKQYEIEQFWLDVLDLPRERLGTSFVNTYSKYSKRLRKNKLPYGTCVVTVSRQRVIQTIFGAIQELAGFDRPEWATM